jgi:LysM repeat protein
MVYIVALAGIVAITMFGLGGMSARFGANTQQPANVQTTQGSQQAGGNSAPNSLSVAPQPDQQTLPNVAQPADTAPNNVPSGGLMPTATPVPPLPTLAAQPAQPAQPTPPVPSGNPPDTAQVTPQEYTPIQAQGGVITGEASTPFYVVQSGDTLSDIAQQLGVDVDALVSVNNLGDDLIYPAQVLYLPPDGGGQAQPPAEATPQSQQPAEPSQAQQEGTTQADVVPAPVTEDVPQVPDMPNTGINKKR